MEKKDIENLREAMGTLPSQNPQKTLDYENALDACYVKLVEYPNNPYKPIVRFCCSTWGSGKIDKNEGSTQKWEKLSPENRFRVVLSCLTGNTLPQAMETIDFLFEYNGVPRHTFDQFARMRIGATIASIGSRDNNKLDSPLILYPELYNDIINDFQLKEAFESWLAKTKDLYEMILSKGSGSWQTARSVLPLSYNHSWTANINFLALKNQCSRRLMFCEESPIVLLFWKMRYEIKNRFPLLANFLRPACDSAKRCIYHEGPEGLTKLFSNLFASCNRYPTNEKYQEFNRSCSDPKEIKKYVEIVEKDGWENYTINDFEKIHEKDKELFFEV